jgi:CRISPR-associated protein Csb2
VARVIRDALLSGYQRTGARNAIPDIISGHSPGGAAAQSVHIAIVPLAFVAHRHADCNVLGFALVPPRGAPVFEDPDFRRALAAIAPADSKRARRIIVVRPRSGTAADETFSLELAPTFEASKRSLDASDYVGPAHVFGTVTPLLLDRHLRKNVDRDLQLAEQIAAACRNIGLPDPVRVLAHRHAAFPGVPSVPAHSSGRPWLRWRIPDSAGGRQLTHAVIEFDRPVRGPVLLGAGRYAGLGLCRPLQEEVE